MDKVMSIVVSCLVAIVVAVLGFALGWVLRTKANEEKLKQIKKAKDEFFGKAVAAQTTVV